MRAQRIKRNIPLNQVDLAIGVHMAYLQAMEEDRFSHLPRGRMAEEMITKYAKYLNIDVTAALMTYRSFQYSEPVEPITDYGAANLVVIRYAGIIRTVLALLVLGGLSYGLWIYENQRIQTIYTQLSGFLSGPPAPPVPRETPIATNSAAAILPPTMTPTTAANPAAPTPSRTALSTQTAAAATQTTRATLTPTIQATSTQTETPSKTAQMAATKSPAKTATAPKKP